jgi:exopolyphosphatase / guanosine-5'-triphosphate,3'-diphosphate pyrophosphatase
VRFLVHGLSASGNRAPEVLAAVDLGSNSFHLVVARYEAGQLIIIDRLREMVRLAEGLDAEGRLDKAVTARCLACLGRFGQRLAHMRADRVRVVGTNALRVARRKQAFLERAREALGHPIEIIAGIEEARLIYSGVAHTLPAEPARRLVVDIGGGSTELIIGEGFEPQQLESLHLGCVTLSQRFFADGKLTAKRFERASVYAAQELEPIQAAYRKAGWDLAVGSSGTVRAIAEALRELDPAATAITGDGVEELVAYVVACGSNRGIDLATVDEERRPVFAAGLTILAEVFRQLRIRQMRVAEGAMREGLLYDMIGRQTGEDARERTVRSMQRRYHVDLAQAQRVENTAVGLLAQVRGPWGLDDPLAELALRWAARLYEIGLDVAHSGYHRHGAYLLENADMPGFAHEEQLLVARLVGCHRRKPLLEGMDDLIPPWDRNAFSLAMLLRLAVLLHRGRSEAPLPALDLRGSPRSPELRLKLRSLDERPLTAADLQQEIELLRATGVRLRVFTRD